MSNSEHKMQGRFLLLRFKNNYSDFPECDIVDFEGPNFIITCTDATTIGIEITEAMHSPEARRNSTTQKKFNEAVVENLMMRMPFKFILDIDLKYGVEVPKTLWNDTVESVTKIILQEFKDLANHQTKRIHAFEANIEGFPLEIQHIIMRDGFRNLPPRG